MRLIPLLLAVLAPMLVACGGGSTAPAVTSAALQGHVFEIDGQTVDRSGVTVSIVETGQTMTTGADGSFDFPTLPVGVITLDFDSGAPRVAGSTGDDSGRRSVDLEDDDRVEVRVSMRDGGIEEFSSSRDGRQRAEARLQPTVAGVGLEAKVKIEARLDGDKFEGEVERLQSGDVVEFFLDDPADEAGFVSIGTATAGVTGEAELELNQRDGELLPLGAARAGDLAGFAVEIRLGSGTLLFTGTVPDLPTGTPSDGGEPGPTDRSRGRARLTAMVTGLEGNIDIRDRPEDGRQRFKMEAEHLAPGESVVFQIEDPDNPGTFIAIGNRVAGGDGEAELELETQDGDALPLNAADVNDLVGLGVRVVRNDAGAQLLLTGTVPTLVAD